MPTDLSRYDNAAFRRTNPRLKSALWFFINVLFFQNPANPFSGLKVWLLRIFGAELGRGVLIKPSVNIKYPWRLRVGDHCWIGEGVWIDNLAAVHIGSHVCLSQGAMLLTGNHDYRSQTFDLRLGEIFLEDGVWIGAKAVVCPGVVCHSHAVLSAGSVATKNLEAYFVYAGNPAEKVRARGMENHGDQNAIPVQNIEASNPPLHDIFRI